MPHTDLEVSYCLLGAMAQSALDSVGLLFGPRMVRDGSQMGVNRRQ